MKHIIILLTILTICGCQTPEKKDPFVIRPSREIISIQTFKESDAYGVQLKWADYRLDENGEIIAESRDIRSAPKVTGTPDQWLNCGINQRPAALSANIAYLIDGERINTDAFPGVNLVARITPMDNHNVRVKGVFVATRFDETRKLAHMSLPIDVVCTLGEEKVLYEKEIRFKPAR